MPRVRRLDMPAMFKSLPQQLALLVSIVVRRSTRLIAAAASAVL